jgi:polysaccharide biosynthesis transport protein
MEQEQRLTTLPRVAELRHTTHEYPGAYGNAYGDEVVEGRRTVQQYFNIIYKRLPLILALAILVTAAAAFYMYRQPSVFQATTQVVIEPRKPKVTSKDSININFGNDVNYYNTQLQLLKNPDLMKKVVIALGLYRKPDLFNGQEKGILASIRAMFSRSKPAAAEQNALPVISDTSQMDQKIGSVVLTPEEQGRVEQFAGMLVGRLSIEPVERTNLVNVTIQHENAELAAKVTDKVAEIFIEEDKERETAGERKAIEDLGSSIEELKATIQQKEGELMAQMRESNLPLLEKGGDLAATRLGSMSETYMKAMENRRNLEARYNAAVAANNRGEATNLPDLYENKIYQDTIRLNTERKAKLQDDIRALDKELEDLEAKRQADATKWMPEHPSMKSLLATIEEKKAVRERKQRETSQIIENDQQKIEKEAVTGALVSLRAQLDAVRKQEAQAQAAYDQEAASANIQGQAATKMTTLKREIETSRSLLDTYTQRQAGIVEGK